MRDAGWAGDPEISKENKPQTSQASEPGDARTSPCSSLRKELKHLPTMLGSVATHGGTYGPTLVNEHMLNAGIMMYLRSMGTSNPRVS